MSLSKIDELRRSGRLAEAAALLEEEGLLEEAEALYVLLWDVEGAVRAARALGELPRVLDHLLGAGRSPEAGALLPELETGTEQVRLRAAEVYERHHRLGDAARLRASVGRIDEALDLYRRSGARLEAAQLLERAGRDREAGAEYEALLRGSRPPAAGEDLAGGEEQAAIHAGLARVLGRFGQRARSIVELQRAIDCAPSVSTRAPLREQLIRDLAAAGHLEAARVALEDLRDERREDSRVLDELLGAPGAGARPEIERRIGGRYVVGRLLGAGVHGRVYAARDLLTDREVAIRLTLPPSEARARTLYERFVNEARAAAALGHPCIVPLLDALPAQGVLVYELMLGGTLEQRLARRPRLGGAEVRSIGLGLSRALTACHSSGLLHRDIRPAHVYFAGDGSIKLGGFGTASLQDLGATRTSGLLVSLAYLSPEQLAGRAPSYASDLYSVGVTLYRALTGRLPMGETAVLRGGEPAVPLAPSRAAPGVDPAWDEPLLAALAPAARDRPSSAGELELMLRQLMLPPEAPVCEPDGTAAATVEVTPTRSERYLKGALLRETGTSSLHLATDLLIGRPVWIEVVGAPGAPLPESVRRLATVTSPWVQRVLDVVVDPSGTRSLLVVYEALGGPEGAAVSDIGQDRELDQARDELRAAGLPPTITEAAPVAGPFGPILPTAGRL